MCVTYHTSSEVDAVAGASFSFECSKDCGALLMLDPTGVSTEIQSKLRIQEYMCTHFTKWTQLANGVLGLGLKDEDLMFVSGTIKTGRWAVAAFNGDYNKKKGSVTGKLGSLAALEFTMAISNVRLDSSYYRVGPPKYRNVAASPMSPELAISGLSAVPESDKHDQCIFLNYWKMKRRTPLFSLCPMKAAAGSHHLPEPDDDADKACEQSRFGVVPDGAFEEIPPTERVSTWTVSCLQWC